MNKYKLKPSVKLITKENEKEYKLYLVDTETGFVAVGNRITHCIVDEFQAEIEVMQAVDRLKIKHSLVPHDKIKKATEHIVQWLYSRDIIVCSQGEE